MKAILGVLLVVAITAATAGSGAATQEQPHALLSVAREPATGDLDAIIERGTLRVLVEYTPTGFFIDGGRLRGFEYELIQRFVETLRKTRPDARRLNVVYVPLPFERMLSALAEGRGDLAAAAITVTSERAAKVDFSRPYLTGVRDALIAGPRPGRRRPLPTWRAPGSTSRAEPATPGTPWRRVGRCGAPDCSRSR